jgi:BCD family chlorophyll transporter-like MFS transporter
MSNATPNASAASDETATAGLPWSGIVRLGLVQAALGAVVVLTTSTLNRVMVVELALPALVPGALVTLHHVVQVCRPRMGHGADSSRRCTPWILGGMGTLALGGWLAAAATVLMATSLSFGLALAVAAFVLIGLGVAASGTSLLALLAQQVAPARRAAAATTVWIMMIAGFVVTAGVSGALLDPYSPQRLLAVAASVAVMAVLVAALAIRGMESGMAGRPAQGAFAQARVEDEAPATASDFRTALREVWSEPQARRFTVFVFCSMLAFSAQDLILEPFAGSVLGFSLGESTRLSGVQHGGTLVGMLLAAAAGSRWGGRSWGSLRSWTVGGCIASGLALFGLSAAGLLGAAWPFKANVWLLGLCTGAFSIAAIGSMMRLAGVGGTHRVGIRMGLWGGAQSMAFALGGLAGTAASDLMRWLIADTGTAYAVVFAFEGLVFLASAALAARIEGADARPINAEASPSPSASPPRQPAAAWRTS